MELGCQPTIQTIQYQRFSQQPDRLLLGSIHPSKAQQRPCSHLPLEYPRTRRRSLSRCGTRCPRAGGRLQREPPGATTCFGSATSTMPVSFYVNTFDCMVPCVNFPTFSMNEPYMPAGISTTATSDPSDCHSSRLTFPKLLKALYALAACSGKTFTAIRICSIFKGRIGLSSSMTIFDCSSALL